MLDYFIQYMEEQDALHLLQFWFAIESFKEATTSHKHTTDHYKQLNTPAVADAVSVATTSDVSGHMTRQTVNVEERPNLECKTDTIIPFPTFDNNTVSNSNTVVQLDEGNSHCNVEGRRNTLSANSDTLENQTAVSEVAPTDGIHIHQRLLKQLSLSKEVISC